MTKKKKSFYYRDWKYKIRLNERAKPQMNNHMNLDSLTYIYLARLGVFAILPHRNAPVFKLKRRFIFKKNMDW